ncbi:hypothetical protein BC937DRAFT_93424, partial [Endogone sp. FLAS-F59071]
GLGRTTLISTEGDRVGNYKGIDINSPEICPYEKIIQKLVNKIREAGVLLILYVMQGQSISASHHNSNTFWEVFKGYKGTWDCSSTATCMMDVSPYMIPLENIWSLEDMHFTKDKYDDYFLNFCKMHFKNIKDKDVIFLQAYIYNTTGHYLGLVTFFMNHIKDHFYSQLKYDDILTFEKIFLYLKSYDFITAVDSGFCIYLFLQSLTQEETQLFDKVYRESINIRLSDNIDQENQRLVKTNLLSKQGGKLDFASPFLHALYLQ